MASSLLVLLLAAAPAFSQGAPSAATPAAPRQMDLTRPLNGKAVVLPHEKEFALLRAFNGEMGAAGFVATFNLSGSERAGTHVDAPAFLIKGGQTVDQLAVEKLAGPGAVVDVSGKAASDPGYKVQLADLLDWENRNQKTLEKQVVLIRTGYGAFYNDRKKYLGTDERGDEALKALRFPGLSIEAAKFLVEQRSIQGFGTDTAGVDASGAFEAHRALLAAGVPVFLNLALERLPETGFQFIALPMRVEGGSSAPVRALAFVRGAN